MLYVLSLGAKIISINKFQNEIQILRMSDIITIFSKIREEFFADYKSPFLIALVENPPIYPLNSKTQNKKGTATILTIMEMLQQYKNSGTVA